MNKQKRILNVLALFVLVALACDLTINFPGTPRTPTPTTASGFPWPDEGGDCFLLTAGPTTIYTRPSTEADVFSEVGAGFQATVTGRTADGWAGFDPGIAQAANIGPFRLRWVFFNDATFSGGCVDVSEVWGPLPGHCYTMPMESVNVYEDADTSSDVLVTLEVEEFAAVTGLTGTGWAQVDLGPGNTGLTGIGWMEQGSLNLNGNTCDELPTVSP
ncbi:MAG: SH3 domain-containing protein [Anaerolineales bacterium]